MAVKPSMSDDGNGHGWSPEVGHVGDLDPDLLGHLAGDRGGQRLARLDEAGEHRHPVAAEPLSAREEERSSASTTAMMTAMSVRG